MNKLKIAVQYTNKKISHKYHYLVGSGLFLVLSLESGIYNAKKSNVSVLSTQG